MLIVSFLPARIQYRTVLGIALGLAAAVESLAWSDVPGSSPQVRLGLMLLALATTVPLAVLQPVGAAIAGSLACVLSLAGFHTLTVAGLLAEVLVLAWAGRYPVAVLALPFPIIALIHPGWQTILLASLAPAAAFAGVARRASGEAAEHSAENASIAGDLLEHTARGERARIARELHDVVAHHISMVAVQAETARLTTPGMPEAGAQRLSAIGDTARAALTEMRRLLGVLREDADVEAAERQPQPGLGQLIDLVDTARGAAGTNMRLILSGPPVPLDPGIELAAYRITQEALTNARRHAPGAAVDVELHYSGESLRLRIRDNGPGKPPGAGHGLLGMRERAAAVGGKLRAGPVIGGGFLVEATFDGEARD